jgi:hypothetical protein
MGMETHGDIVRENRITREKACPSVTLSTITNLIWTDPDANPGLRTERPATNHLSHRMVYLYGKERGLL